MSEERCTGWCGDCARARLTKSACEEIEYFEDEELDVYRGRPADGYSDEEVAEFYEVMTTMRREEVPAWLASLKRRGINLPKQLS